MSSTNLTFPSVSQTKFNFAADLIEHQKRTVIANPTAVKARENLDVATMMASEYFKLSDHMLGSIKTLKSNGAWTKILACAKQDLAAAFDLLQEYMFESSNILLEAFSQAYPTKAGSPNAEVNKQSLPILRQF